MKSTTPNKPHVSLRSRASPRYLFNLLSRPALAGTTVLASLIQFVEVAAYVTPSHPPGPDVDGALHLLSAMETMYDVPIDRQEIAEIREHWHRFYTEMADRMNSLVNSDEPVESYNYPEDRAYM